MDLIDRKQALNDRGLSEFHYYDDYVKMKNYIKSLPTVEALPLSVIDEIKKEVARIDSTCYAYEFCADEFYYIVDDVIARWKSDNTI